MVRTGFLQTYGVALILAGIGFGVLALGGALRNEESTLLRRGKPSPTPIPTT